MRGPFLSHRLKVGLVNNLDDLGETLRIPIIIDGVRREKEFSLSEFPNYLVLPQLHDLPAMLTGETRSNFGRVSYSIWGIEEQLRALHAEGNAVLLENFNIDYFGRAISKIAHGLAAGWLGLDNFEPLLPEYILGKAHERACHLIGNWGEDGMAKPSGILHQVGLAFREWRDGRIIIETRIRLFAEYENTPIYRVMTGFLSKSLDEVLAPIGLRPVPPNE
jgi:hypothetical protein